MLTSLLTAAALLGTGGLYLLLSARYQKRSKTLDDHLPMTSDDRQARVLNPQEFNAATVATTISLATVILAYAELAPYLGTWLLWTVFTTATGILVVRFAAHRMWRKLAAFHEHRPTLHEFLGAVFDSHTLAKSAALCTSIGFISALAVELTVGARFLSGLAPEVPQWLAVLVLAGIGIAYTSMGGFRAVIVTDRIQMASIWAAIMALAVAIAWFVATSGGTALLAKAIPQSVYDFSWREGLGSFLIGIVLINVPTYIADMSIWQRVAASKNEDVVTEGLTKSVLNAAGSWCALALLACLLVGVAIPKEGENLLTVFLLSLPIHNAVLGGALFLIIVTGLYGASLSTASTQLIAAGHALHMDLLRFGHDRAELAKSARELASSRMILLLVSVLAVLIVESLRAVGFSIADLVFAVFGAQLGLVPLVLAALFLRRDKVKRLSNWGAWAAPVGFLAGWSSAILGKLTGSADLIFLSPLFSLSASSFILLCGVAGLKPQHAD